jgi:hypothetical protein
MSNGCYTITKYTSKEEHKIQKNIELVKMCARMAVKTTQKFNIHIKYKFRMADYSKVG